MPSPPRKPSLAGQFSEARDAWVSTGEGDFILYVVEDDNDARLHVDFQGRRVRIRLHGLTGSELDALEEFFKYTIERVRPYVEAWDQKAQEAADSGDFTHIRIYRPPGKFIVRPRSQREHDQVVQERSEDVSPVDESAGEEG